jgi:hypothetical protein
MVSDDAHPSGFTGLTGSAITGAVATGIATVPGVTLLSVMGATDLALTPTQVAVDAVTVTVRIVST